jgi:hypothetical protein
MVGRPSEWFEMSNMSNNVQLHCIHFFGTEKRKPIASILGDILWRLFMGNTSR